MVASLSPTHIGAIQFAMRTLALSNAVVPSQPVHPFILFVDPEKWYNATHAGASAADKHDASLFESHVTQEIHHLILDALLGLDKWTYDIFLIEERSCGNPLFYVIFSLFHKFDLFERLSIDKETMRKFVCGVEAGYRASVPYHNSTHAADVAQSVHFFLTMVDMPQYLTAEEMFSLIMAAALHDYRHPGVTERFCTDLSHEMSLVYNDIYVFESFHAAASLQFLMSDVSVDVLAAHSPRARQRIRSQIIRLILATNLTDHFTFVKTFTRMVTTQASAGGNPHQVTIDNKQLVMQAMVKCADVSNPAKPFAVYAEWTARIMEEFFLQGDIEKALDLPVSRFMDRLYPEVPTCQIGFIDFIVAPIFKALGEFCPNVKQVCLPIIEANRAMWADVQKATVASTVPQPALPPTPPVLGASWGGTKHAEATKGMRAFATAAMPHRVFGEGRSPIYDAAFGGVPNAAIAIPPALMSTASSSSSSSSSPSASPSSSAANDDLLRSTSTTTVDSPTHASAFPLPTPRPDVHPFLALTGLPVTHVPLFSPPGTSRLDRRLSTKFLPSRDVNQDDMSVWGTGTASGGALAYTRRHSVTRRPSISHAEGGSTSSALLLAVVRR
jgi:hypothetical protein